MLFFGRNGKYLLDIKNSGGLYTSQNCLRTALLIGGGHGRMGDVSTKTVSFKKLSGRDLENKKLEN